MNVLFRGANRLHRIAPASGICVDLSAGLV